MRGMESQLPSRFDPASAAAAPRTRALADTPELAALAISMLRTSNATVDLNDTEARTVLAYLRLAVFPKGATLMHEGDRANTNYMLLVLSGEVSVDVADDGHPEAVAVSVLGPGNLVGEMGLIDGAPRSATCKAITDVQAAGLSRVGLQRLIEEHPRVGARLVVLISMRIAERLRGMGDQIAMYSRLAAQQAAEIERLKAGRR